MTDLDELKRLASAATPGMWKAHRGTVKNGRFNLCPQVTSGVNNGNLRENSEKAECNAAFIAAANPAVVLELIEEIEDLRRQLDTMGRY